MTQPLFWLVLTTIATTLMWMPYILNAMAVRGVMATMGNPVPNPKPLAPWAERAKKAHTNAIENLPAFAALIIAAHLTNTPAGAVATAATVYFYVRLAHYTVYTFGAPYVRTVLFLTGFGANLAIAAAILKHVA